MPRPDYEAMTPDQLAAAAEEIIRRAEAGRQAILSDATKEMTKEAVESFASSVLDLRFNAVYKELFPNNDREAVCRKIREDVIAGRPQAEIEADEANADPRVRPFIGMFVRAVQEDRNAVEESRGLIRLALLGKEYPNLDLEKTAADCRKVGLNAGEPTAKSISRRNKALTHMVDRVMDAQDAASTTLPRWANNLLKKPGLSPEARRQIIDDFNSGREGQQRVFDYCLGELLNVDPEVFNLRTLDDYLNDPAQVDYYALVGWDLDHTLTDVKRRGLTVDPQKAALAGLVSQQMGSYNNHFRYVMEAAANPISVIFPELPTDLDSIDRLMASAEMYTFPHRFAMTTYQAEGMRPEDPEPVLTALAGQSGFDNLPEYFSGAPNAQMTLTACAREAVRKDLSKEVFDREMDLLVKTARIPQTAEKLNQSLEASGNPRRFRVLSDEEKRQRRDNRRAALESARELAWENAQSDHLEFTGKDLVIGVREYAHLIYRHDLTVEENREILARYTAGDRRAKAEILEESLRHHLAIIGNPDDYRQPISDEDLAVMWPPLGHALQALVQDYSDAMKTLGAAGILISPELEQEVLRVKKAMDPVLTHYASRFNLMTCSYYTELDEKELVRENLATQLFNTLENSGTKNNELEKISEETSSMFAAETGYEGEYLLNTLPPELASPDAVYGLKGREASPKSKAEVGAAAEDGILLVWKEGMEYPAAFTVEKSVFPPQARRIPYERFASFVEGKIRNFDFSSIPDDQIDFAQAALSAYLDARGGIAEKQAQLNAERAQDRQREADAQQAREAELGRLASGFTAANVAKGRLKDEAKERLSAQIREQQAALGVTLSRVSELPREEFGDRLRGSLSMIMAAKMVHDKLDTVYLTSSEQALREITDGRKIAAAAAEMRRSQMFNLFVNELTPQDLRNLSIDADGRPVMENALSAYNERFTQAVIDIQKREADRSADFWKIRREARERNDATEEFLNAVEARSAYTRYNQNRLDDKQVLSDMLLVYSPYAARDPKLAPVMDKLKLLAGDTSTATRGDYWQESGRYLDVIAELQKYEADLDRQEEELVAESRRLFKKEDGSWMSDEELRSIDTDPALRQKNLEQIRRSETIDNRRRICADLRNYLESQRDGRLNEVTVDRNGKVIEREDIFDGTNVKMNYVLKTEGTKARIGTSLVWQMRPTDAPLFPHEPCMQDIAQGALGDCYYLSALANIARLHPEKIKEAIRENPDGKTVTVRLFAKGGDGKLKPNYIVVDKVIPRIGNRAEEGGVHCLWVSCFERALAISGLNRSADNRMVPKDIRQRAERLAGKREYTDADKRDNPWLFSEGQFIGWPAYESINGGDTGRITEALMGPGYERLNVKMPDKKSIDRFYLNYNLKDPATLYELTFRREELHAKVPGKKMDLQMTGEYEKGRQDVIRRVMDGKVPTPEEEQQIGNAFRLFDREFARVFPKGTAMDLENLKELAEKMDTDDKLQLGPRGLMAYSVLQDNLNGVLSDSEIYNVAENNVYKVIREGREKGLYMSAGSTDGERKTGVFDSHAYGVLGAYADPETGLRYIRLRNPWGNRIGLFRRFGGPENAMLSTLDAHGQVQTVQGEQEEGVFDMEIHDFIHDFDRLQLNGMELNRDSMETGRDYPDAFWQFQKIHDQTFLRKTFLNSVLDNLGNAGDLLEKSWKDDLQEDEWLNIVKTAVNAEMDEMGYEEGPEREEDFEKRMGAAKGLWQKCQETMTMVSELDPALGDREFLETIADRLQDLADKGPDTEMQALGSASRRFQGMAESVRRAEDVYQKVSDVLERKAGTRIYLCKGKNSIANSFDGYVEVLGVGVNEEGKKVLKVRDNTEHDLSLAGLAHDFSKVSFEQPAPERVPEPAPERAPDQAPDQRPTVVDYRTMSNYLRTVTDYYQALCHTDHCMSRDSAAYTDLKKCLKEVSLEIIHTRGKSFDRLVDAMRPLEEKCRAYRDHCAEDPKKAGNWRRNTRVDIVKGLDALTAAARERKANPRLGVQREIAGKLVEDALRTRGRRISPEAVKAAADKLVVNKYFSGKVDRENLYFLQKYNGDQIHKLNLALEGQDPKMVTEKENSVLNVEQHAANRVL